MVLAPIVALGAALRWSRWPRFALGIGTVAFFVVLTGAEPSVMRAGVMAGLALIGVLLGRPRSAGSILAGAVVVLLVIDPALVWSVGFQLSVAAAASMVALATPILAPRSPRRTWPCSSGSWSWTSTRSGSSSSACRPPTNSAVSLGR